MADITIGADLNQSMSALYRDIEGEILSQYHDRVLPQENASQHQDNAETEGELAFSRDGGLRQIERQEEIGGDAAPPEDDDEYERASILGSGGIRRTFDSGSNDFQRYPQGKHAPKNEGIRRTPGKWQRAQGRTSCVLY